MVTGIWIMSKRKRSIVLLLAESFKRKIGGQKSIIPIPSRLRKIVGGGITMAICFIALVKQYLTTTQFDDKTVQGIFDEAFKV